MYDLLGGYLLLCSKLGQQGRKPLSHKDFHKFLSLNTDLNGAALHPRCPKALPQLVEDHALMQQYAKRRPADIIALILPDSRYPQIVKERLRDEAPGILWCKGNLSLLEMPAISVVGSRDPSPQAAEFTRLVGQMAARQGFVLVSGNAGGTDTLAQNACLEAGGYVISVVADSLLDKQTHDRILYMSEDDYDQSFSGARALSRNQVIHAMGQRTFVSQSGWGRGGTYSGTYRNLKNGWSPVYMHNDGSIAATEFAALGASLMDIRDL